MDWGRVVLVADSREYVTVRVRIRVWVVSVDVPEQVTRHSTVGRMFY